MSMREFFETPKGRAVSISVLLVGLGVVIWSIHSNFASSSAYNTAMDPVFMNAETGYVFHLKLKTGMTFPVVCPDTGKATGYIPEACYWTSDGHAKSDPTYVILNEDRGISGPTFCPDCGRLVILHNPMAVEGHRPPPTKDQYYAERGQSASNGN